MGKKSRFWTLAVLCMGLAGCATTESGSAEGRYLQVSNAGRVVAEIDTGAGGMASCGNQIAMMKANRSGGVTDMRCSPTPSAEPLPFGFVVQQMQRESDGFKPSSPYLVRVDTRVRCVRIREETARAEKTVIVEDRCQ